MITLNLRGQYPTLSTFSISIWCRGPLMALCALSPSSQMRHFVSRSISSTSIMPTLKSQFCLSTTSSAFSLLSISYNFSLSTYFSLEQCGKSPTKEAEFLSLTILVLRSTQSDSGRKSMFTAPFLARSVSFVIQQRRFHSQNDVNGVFSWICSRFDSYKLSNPCQNSRHTFPCLSPQIPLPSSNLSLFGNNSSSLNSLASPCKALAMVHLYPSAFSFHNWYCLQVARHSISILESTSRLLPFSTLARQACPMDCGSHCWEFALPIVNIISQIVIPLGWIGRNETLYNCLQMRRIQSKHLHTGEPLNLLDLVLPSTTADTNIHTFTEFKEWMNSSFHIKTQLNSASYIKKSEQVKRSVKVKQAKSLSQHVVESHLQLKRRPSQTFQGLGLIEEGKEAMESSYNTQSKKISRQNSNDGDLGFDLQENSILGSKSAHSSRSFNGYQQINEYELRECLGRGSFAKVFLAYDTTSPLEAKYAVKVMESAQIKKKFLLRKNSQMLDSEEEKPEEESGRPKESLASLFVRNEVAILKKMSHQYITKLYDVIVDNEKSRVYLVLEYCGGGFINESKTEKGQYRKLLESQCKRYYRQLCVALDYIHNTAKIAHRDIKPENLLLNEVDEVKISDFGLGTHKLKGKKQSGTPLYMPPQSLDKDGEFSSQAGDIWALGVTLLVLLTAKHPEFQQQLINVEKELAALKDVSSACKDFIRRCLEPNMQKRLKASELLQQEWLGGEGGLRVSNNPYAIEITPADELNIFKHVSKLPQVNIFKST